jgi:hypothetical protein
LGPPREGAGEPPAAAGEYNNMLDRLSDHPADPAGDPEALSVEDLQVALRDALRERETELRSQFIAGTAPLADLLEASDHVLQAELALRNNPTERLDLQKKYLANLTKFEAKIEAYMRTGASRITRADFLALKAIRLKAQIAIAKTPRY